VSNVSFLFLFFSFYFLSYLFSFITYYIILKKTLWSLIFEFYIINKLLILYDNHLMLVCWSFYYSLLYITRVVSNFIYQQNFFPVCIQLKFQQNRSFRIYKKMWTLPIVSPLHIFHSVSPITRYSGQGNGQRRGRRTGRLRGGRCGRGRGKALRDARAVRIAVEHRWDATVGPDAKTDEAFWLSGGDASGGAGFSLDASQ